MINDEHGRFFPTHVTLQSHEDTRAYANVYSYVKEHLGQAPEKWMADAAKEITAAGEEGMNQMKPFSPFHSINITSPKHYYNLYT